MDNAELIELRQEIADLRNDVRGLLDAWNTAKGLVKFVKFLSGLATAVTAIWALFKLGKSN